MNRIIEKDHVKTLESRMNTGFISIKEDHATIRQTRVLRIVEENRKRKSG